MTSQTQEAIKDGEALEALYRCPHFNRIILARYLTSDILHIANESLYHEDDYTVLQLKARTILKDTFKEIISTYDEAKENSKLDKE